MLTRSTKPWFLALTGFLFLACSSAPPTATKASSAQKSDNDTSANKTAGATSPTDNAPGAPAAPGAAAAAAPNAATCGAKANHEDCATCCEGADGASVKVSNAAFDKCSCAQATSQCAPECAKPFCSTDTDSDGTSSASSSDDPCASCLPDVTTCDAAATTACNADPTCAAATKCYADAKCDSKPLGPDEEASSGSSSDGN